MELLLIRGGRGGEKGRGRVPPVITVSPGSRAARIVTGCDSNECHY